MQSGPQNGYTSSGNLKSYEGHFMVATGVDTIDGQTIIRYNDPGQQESKRGIVYKTLEQFKKSRKLFYKIMPNNTNT